MGAFGLLLDGCPVLPGPESAAVGPDGSVTLRFSAAVTANGYYFTTAGPDPAHDPIAWSVEGLIATSPPPPPDGNEDSAGVMAIAGSVHDSFPSTTRGRGFGCNGSASTATVLPDLLGRAATGLAEPDSEAEWVGFGASAWRLDVHGALHLYPGRQYATPAAPRGARVEVRTVNMDNGLFDLNRPIFVYALYTYIHIYICMYR